MQSNATEGTLIWNALGAGYPENAVDEMVVTPAEYAAMVASQPKTAEEIVDALIGAVDAYMDGKAQVLGFKDRHSFALRAGIPGSSWHTKALVFGAWMDAINDYCWQAKLDCQNGLRTIPTVEQLIAELPTL